MASTSTVHFQKCHALPVVELRHAFRSTACYHTHTHDEFSFGVIDQGNATYTNGQRKMKTGQESLVLINPGEAHACNPAKVDWSYRMLFVDAEWIGRLQQECTGEYGVDFRPFDRPLENASSSVQEFDRLYRILSQNQDTMAAEEALIDFILMRFRAMPKMAQTSTAHKELIYARERLLDSPEEALTIELLAKEVGLSRFHLIRQFKQHYGQTPHAFQLDEKVKKAKKMLQSGQAIAETALALGFADQSHFQRHFKKRTAVTPGQYQNCFRS